MPKEDAMDVAGIASHRFQYRLRASQLARELRTGEDVLQGSRVAHVFPPMLLSAAKVGTNDQPNFRVLEQVAALYRSRSSSSQSWLDQGLGLLFVVALGGLVGFMVIALFMPLVSLVTSLSGAS
jgi:type II secretory pathway component PulF